MIDLPSQEELLELRRLASHSPDGEAFRLLASGRCLRLGLIARRTSEGTALLLEAALTPAACPDIACAALEMGLKETFRDGGTIVYEMAVQEGGMELAAEKVWSLAMRS
jgi:hypothetical protein